MRNAILARWMADSRPTSAPDLRSRGHIRVTGCAGVLTRLVLTRTLRRPERSAARFHSHGNTVPGRIAGTRWRQDRASRLTPTSDLLESCGLHHWPRPLTCSLGPSAVGAVLLLTSRLAPLLPTPPLPSAPSLLARARPSSSACYIHDSGLSLPRGALTSWVHPERSASPPTHLQGGLPDCSGDCSPSELHCASEHNTLVYQAPCVRWSPLICLVCSDL